MQKSKCLIVPKKLGQKAIGLVTELELFNRDLQIHQSGDSVYIPLKKEPLQSILKIFKKELYTFKILEHEFTKRKKRHFVPIDFLKNKLPQNLLSAIPNAIDFVGDIAIVEIPKQLEEKKNIIGEAILAAHKQTNTVFAKSGAVKGVYRIRDLELIAGDNKTTTVYKEYGYSYHVDVAKVYFSPRLSGEHHRVALQVNKGEIVVDLFAGVGPFAIPIAKKSKDVKVYAVDINPDAVDLLKKNISLNHLEKQIIPLMGDARNVVNEQLYKKADRVLMNLPEKAIDFVDIACKAIKPIGGIIHYYCFVYDSEPLEKAKVHLVKALNEQNRVFEIISVKTVRAIAPYAWQVVVDVKVK